MSLKRKRKSKWEQIYGNDSSEEEEEEEEEEEPAKEARRAPPGICEDVWKCLLPNVQQELLVERSEQEVQVGSSHESSGASSLLLVNDILDRIEENVNEMYRNQQMRPLPCSVSLERSSRNSHDNAKDIKIEEDSYRGHRDPATGWVMQPDHVNAIAFADSNRPSTWMNHNVNFIYIHNLLEKGTANSQHYVGKWMWFVDSNHVDDVFVQVACSLVEGKLGQSAKVPPPDTSKQHDKSCVVIIYTKDYRNEADVLRVGLELRKLGANQTTLSYKPDVFTFSIDSNCPRSIYQLKLGEDTLFKVNDGKALSLAIEMSEKEAHGEIY